MRLRNDVQYEGGVNVQYLVSDGFPTPIAKRNLTTGRYSISKSPVEGRNIRTFVRGFVCHDRSLTHPNNLQRMRRHRKQSLVKVLVVMSLPNAKQPRYKTLNFSLFRPEKRSCHFRATFKK